jgi:toxin ParE1/3/4
MKRKIIKTPEARRDLIEIADYIARDSIDAALRFLDMADHEFAQLALMPGMGPCREFSSDRLGEVRSWPIKGFMNYLIFYRELPGAIEVLRVIHGARNIDEVFGT